MKPRLILIFILVVISLVSGLPHLIGVYNNGLNYSLFSRAPSLTTQEEIFAFMARTQQVVRGNYFPKDNQVYEYQTSPSPFVNEALPANVMGLFAKITGSVEISFILADFIYPPLLFLIIFLFLKSLAHANIFSTAVGLSCVFVRQLFLYLPYPWPTFKMLFLQDKFIDDLVATRLFHPELSGIFLFLAIILSYYAFENKRKSNLYAAGIFFGLTFYTYPYHWTALFFGLLIFAVMNFKNQEILLKILTIAAIGLMVGLPFIMNFSQFVRSEFYQDFSIRAANIRNEFPLSESRRFFIISLAVFLFLKLKKNQNLGIIFLNSVIFGAAILPDLSNWLFKKDFQTIHWIWVIVFPISCLLYFQLMEKYIFCGIKQRHKNFIYLLFILSFIFYAFKTQLYVALKYHKNYRLFADEKELVKKIRLLPKKSVIAISPIENPGLQLINSYIPAFSENFIYVPFEIMTLAPNEEIAQRNMVALSFVKDNSGIIGDYKRIFLNSYTLFNEKVFEQETQEFKKSLMKKIKYLGKICKKYKIDYLLVHHESKVKTNCFEVKLVFHNQTYDIYRVIKI